MSAFPKMGLYMRCPAAAKRRGGFEISKKLSRKKQLLSCTSTAARTHLTLQSVSKEGGRFVRPCRVSHEPVVRPQKKAGRHNEFFSSVCLCLLQLSFACVKRGSLLLLLASCSRCCSCCTDGAVVERGHRKEEEEEVTFSLVRERFVLVVECVCAEDQFMPLWKNPKAGLTRRRRLYRTTLSFSLSVVSELPTFGSLD